MIGGELLFSIQSLSRGIGQPDYSSKRVVLFCNRRLVVGIYHSQNLSAVKSSKDKALTLDTNNPVRLVKDSHRSLFAFEVWMPSFA